jgi:hypothetical protein
MRQLKLAVVECRPECHSLHKEDLCSNNPTVHRWAATNTNHTVNVKESVNASATTRPLLQQPHKLRLNVMTNKVNKTFLSEKRRRNPSSLHQSSLFSRVTKCLFLNNNNNKQPKKRKTKKTIDLDSIFSFFSLSLSL